jgi:redox-sensitive bicupin YhaK (pirin superfamily)
MVCQAGYSKPKTLSNILTVLFKTLEGEGATARVIAGRFFGQTSPAPASSPLFYVDLL